MWENATDFPICGGLVSWRQSDCLEDLLDSGSFMVVRQVNHIRGAVVNSVVIRVHLK